MPAIPASMGTYLSALEVCSRRGAIQIHVYLYLYLNKAYCDAKLAVFPYSNCRDRRQYTHCALRTEGSTNFFTIRTLYYRHWLAGGGGVGDDVIITWHHRCRCPPRTGIQTWACSCSCPRARRWCRRRRGWWSSWRQAWARRHRLGADTSERTCERVCGLCRCLRPPSPLSDAITPYSSNHV